LNNDNSINTNLIKVNEEYNKDNNNNRENQNNFNMTTKSQLFNKKISDIPLLSSLYFNKSYKKTEFYSENTIKDSNTSNNKKLFKNFHNNLTSIQHDSSINPENINKINSNAKFIKSDYLNSTNFKNKMFNILIDNDNLNNKKNLNSNELDHLQLKNMSVFPFPKDKITNKKNIQNDSKSITRPSDFDNKIVNNNKIIKYNKENSIYDNDNSYYQKEEIDNKKNYNFMITNNGNSFMNKFLQINTSNSPQHVIDKQVIKNYTNKNENNEVKSLNIKNINNNKNNYLTNNDNKITSNHKFFLDLNKIKYIKNVSKNNIAVASFDYEDESKSKLVLETSNESNRSSIRESIHYKKESERLSNYIKDCNIYNNIFYEIFIIIFALNL